MKKLFLTVLLVSASTIIPSEKNPYSIKLLTKEELKPLLPFVAALRIKIFREYPYLYEGDFIEEMEDLRNCSQKSHNAVAIACHNNIPIGFLYGIPLTEFASHFENPVVDLFKEKKLAPETCYYFADIIILPEHRGNHLSKKLFDTLETYAQEQGYCSASFITESHEFHPLKPVDYKSLDPLWNSLNYKKTGLVSHGSWQTHKADGTIVKELHVADIWFKNLTK